MSKLASMNDLKDRQRLSWEGLFYSIQRIDLLIISISGAGIYVCLETLKYLNENCIQHNLLVKVSGIFLLASIVLNFISQIYGKNANYYDYLMCEEQIKVGSNEPKDEETKKIDEYDSKSESASKKTNSLTNWSMGAMFIGLACLIGYFLFTF
ncbi:MAG: hypothetical protein ACX93I_10910 [Winogradskyella sp.]